MRGESPYAVGQTVICTEGNSRDMVADQCLTGRHPAPRYLYGPLAQRLERATHNRPVAGSNPARATNCGHRIMAITSAFQADDAGSIPADRSR